MDDKIPKLSWLCRINQESANFTVGPNVEHANSWIAEGAWAGEFSGKALKDSEFVFGSGVVWNGKRIVFIPPKHIFESLYVLVDKSNETTYISNSLLFAIRRAEAALDGEFLSRLADCLNDSINAASERGIDRYEQRVLQDEKYVLYRMLYYNFEVDRLGRIRILPRTPRIRFSNFIRYRRFLTKTIASIIQNGHDAGRSAAYQPITTVSKGYDSPTVSVLARECGCEEALTLDVSVYGVDDSGEEIGRALGYRLHPCRHVMTALSDESNNIENLNVGFSGELQKTALEFIATGGVGDDVAFYSFKDWLPGRIFMTGSFGDSMWTRGSQVKPGMSCTIPFMKSITEFRLRIGFVFFPVPFLAARFPAAVIRISDSKALREFSVGTDYDRPICRKIVEEAGIPRDWFGIRKNATAPLILNHGELFEEAVRQIGERYA